MAKFLNTDRSWFRYFWPLMYGKMKLPFWPAEGAAKQLGLKRYPLGTPLVGSQVSFGWAGTCGEPETRVALMSVPSASVPVMLKFVLVAACNGAPLM